MGYHSTVRVSCTEWLNPGAVPVTVSAKVPGRVGWVEAGGGVGPDDPLPGFIPRLHPIRVMAKNPSKRIPLRRLLTRKPIGTAIARASPILGK